MTMNAIVVVDRNWGIGKDGDQQVYLKEDLKRFKALTMGHAVILEVGENTAGGGIVLKIVKHPVHLIHLSLPVDMLDAQLIAVGLADGAALIGPGIPDVAI